MLHACVQRFNVTKNLENFWELNKAIIEHWGFHVLCSQHRFITRTEDGHCFLEKKNDGHSFFEKEYIKNIIAQY